MEKMSISVILSLFLPNWDPVPLSTGHFGENGLKHDKSHQKWLDTCSQKFSITQNLISIFEKIDDYIPERVRPPWTAHSSPYPKFFQNKKSKESASHHLMKLDLKA